MMNFFIDVDRRHIRIKREHLSVVAVGQHVDPIMAQVGQGANKRGRQQRVPNVVPTDHQGSHEPSYTVDGGMADPRGWSYDTGFMPVFNQLSSRRGKKGINGVLTG